MKQSLRILTLAALVVGAAAAQAQVNATLIGRTAGSGAGASAFRFTNDVSITSAQIRLNDNNQLAVRGVATAGNQIWTGNSAGFSSVYTSPSDTISSSLGFNNSGQIVFEQLSTPGSGIRLYNPSTGTTSVYFNGPVGVSGWASPSINATGQVGFRGAISGGQNWSSYDPVTGTYSTVATATSGAASGISFLFTPSFNNSRQIGGMIRFDNTTNRDVIRRYNSDGSFVTIAETTLVNASSQFTAFSNLLAMNNNGQFAFTATVAGGARVMMIGDQNGLVEVARTNTNGLGGSFDAFAPSINDNGLVTFRATDSSNRRAIWVAGSGFLTRVIREGDSLNTDVGLATAQWDSTFSANAFSGNPVINNNNQVAFITTLLAPSTTSTRWGNGVFLTEAVPEPMTMTILALGAAALAKRRRNKKR